MMKYPNYHAFMRCLLVAFNMVVILQVSGQSIEKDIALGNEAAKMLEEQVGICDDLQASLYLDSIGARLVKKLGRQPFQYNFHVLNMSEPNAMALPGGHVYFSRGILLLANSEDELAGVMGHEIIHAHNRHSMKAMKKGILPAVLQLPGELIKKTISPAMGELLNAPIGAVGNLYTSNYSRKNESEADKVGIALAAKAGYNPTALGYLLKRIDEEIEFLSGERSTFSYFDSHPYTPDRVKRINDLSSNIVPAEISPYAKTRHDFLKQFDGVSVSSDPAKGVFRDSLFLHPDLGFSVVFPSGWSTDNMDASVIATHKKKEAQLMFGISGPAGNPSDYANEFLKQLYEKGKVTPLRNDSLVVNGHRAHIVSLADHSARETVYVHLLWLVMGSNTYQFIGVGIKAHEEVMRQTVLSFSPISTEQRNSIFELIIRVAQPQSSETFESFSSRTGNVFPLSFLGLINGTTEEDVLAKKDGIKIGVREPYRKKEDK